MSIDYGQSGNYNLKRIGDGILKEYMDLSQIIQILMSIWNLGLEARLTLKKIRPLGTDVPAENNNIKGYLIIKNVSKYDR
jgi:hypothetical protein